MGETYIRKIEFEKHYLCIGMQINDTASTCPAFPRPWVQFPVLQKVNNPIFHIQKEV